MISLSPSESVKFTKKNEAPATVGCAVATEDLSFMVLSVSSPTSRERCNMSSPVSMRARRHHTDGKSREGGTDGRDRSYKPASRPSCKSMAEESRHDTGRGGDSAERLR